MQLRPATQEDEEQLLVWRNDPLTCAMSHHTDPISQEEHKDWLELSLASDTRRIFVAEANGVPVGTLRVDREQGYSVLSWTIAPEARNKGYGAAMLAVFLKEYPGFYRAEVKELNTASRKICIKNGFIESHTGHDIIHYTWQP